MNQVPKSSEIYLDANFLAAYLLGSHSDASRAQVLFAKILVAKTTMVFSPLSIDEMLHAIYKTLRDQERVNGQLPDKSHKDYINELRKALTILLADSSCRLTQFTDDERASCSRVIDNIENYNLSPRDAFHLSYLQDQYITHIVTNDSHFSSIPIVNCINF
jgi:predicted nucleic acid-binding protein